MEEISKLTEKIIGCAIEVHRVLGPGLLESDYSDPSLPRCGVVALWQDLVSQ
jgi:hypothetical protein